MARVTPIIFFLAGTVTVSAQGIKMEQAAFDYFFNNLFQKEFPGISTIQFSGCTEEEVTSFGFNKICFVGEDDLRNQIESAASGVKRQSKDIDLSTASGVKFKKGNAKHKLHVLQVNEVDDKSYVLLEIIEKQDHTFGYYLELDNTQKVLRWCRTEMTH